MENHGVVLFKIFLITENGCEEEVRRFALPQYVATNFEKVSEKIRHAFPSISDQQFSVFWKDQENDNVAISSDEELICALTEIISDVKKLYAKIVGPTPKLDSCDGILHPMVVCDFCGNSIKGNRYKCISCEDFDLCNSCEKLSAHSEHPMLRISHPHMFDPYALYKLTKMAASFMTDKLLDSKHHCHHNKKKHFHKKKRGDKEVGSPNDSDNYVDESCKKYEKKKRINNVELCKHLLSEYMQYCSPIHFEVESKKQDNYQTKSDRCTYDEQSHIKHLNKIGKTISSLLDTLGINVDIEVKSNVKEEKKEKLDNDEFKNKEPAGIGNTSKKVQLDTNAEKEDEIIHKITSIFADQKMTDSSDKDDWVSVEHDKEFTKENSPSKYTGAVPKVYSETEKHNGESSDSTSLHQSPTLYPNLNEKQCQLSTHVRQALDKMFEMGFTNEDGWLTQLLVTTNGDIREALNIITRNYEKKAGNV